MRQTNATKRKKERKKTTRYIYHRILPVVEPICAIEDEWRHGGFLYVAVVVEAIDFLHPTRTIRLVLRFVVVVDAVVVVVVDRLDHFPIVVVVVGHSNKGRVCGISNPGVPRT